MTTRYLPVRCPPGRGEQRGRLRQDEFARRCGLHPELLRRYVALGLVSAVPDADGVLWFSTSQIAAVARLQRLRAALPLNYAALGLVVDLLDRIAELETALRIRGYTQPGHRPAGTEQPIAGDKTASGRDRWT